MVSLNGNNVAFRKDFFVMFEKNLVKVKEH